MAGKLTFLTGVAVGYVLGAKAGRERYEQIRKATGSFLGSPPVQQAGQAAAEFGREAGGRVTRRIGERLPERFGRYLPDGAAARFGANGSAGGASRHGRGL